MIVVLRYVMYFVVGVMIIKLVNVFSNNFSKFVVFLKIYFRIN